MTRRNRNVLFEFQAYFVRIFSHRRHAIASRKKEFCDDMKFFREGGTVPMQFYREICLPLLLHYLDINQDELQHLVETETQSQRISHQHDYGFSNGAHASDSALNNNANSVLERFTSQDSASEDGQRAVLIPASTASEEYPLIVDDDEDLVDDCWSTDSSDTYKDDTALNDKVNSFLERWAGDFSEVAEEILDDRPRIGSFEGKTDRCHAGSIEEVFDSMGLADENDLNATLNGSGPLIPSHSLLSEIYDNDLDLSESECPTEEDDDDDEDDEDDEDLSYSCAWTGVEEPWQTEAIVLSILALRKLKLEEENAERWYSIELNRLEEEHAEFHDSILQYVKRQQNGRGSLLRNEVFLEDIKIPMRTTQTLLGPAVA